jgi:dephospho-CoA kinase
MEQQKKTSKIIGFSGKKGAGKDTAALALSNFESSEFFSFAKSLKDISKEVFQLTDDQLYINKEIIDERYGKTPRQLLQELGSSMRKHLGDDVFVESLKRKIIDSSADYIVITDVRYENECSLIKQSGGIVIMIKRPGLVSTDTHESENQELEVDRTVINDGTVDDLHDKIIELLEL